MSCSPQGIARLSFSHAILYTHRTRLLLHRATSGQAQIYNPRWATSGRTDRAREERSIAATVALRPAPAQTQTPAHGLSQTRQPLFHVSSPLQPPLPPCSHSISQISVKGRYCRQPPPNHTSSNRTLAFSHYLRIGIMHSIQLELGSGVIIWEN